MYQKSIILLLALGVCFNLSNADPQCLNQNNEPVDWFIALKFPSGTNYAYCDSIDCSKLVVQDKKLDDLSASPLFNTLGQVQDISSDEYATLFWNDEPPTFDVSTSYAHAKGFIGTGKKNGFLVVHSTPKFPFIENGKIQLQIKANQTIYGQHYFCISTQAFSLNQIAAAYNVDWPYVYDGHVPPSFSDFPSLTRMLQNYRDLTTFNVISFLTLEGVTMTKFAKSGKWLVPFYDNLPAALLEVGLVVESWRFDEGSDCDQEYIVTNNLVVSFPGSVNYKETADHSKYAVSLDDDKPYVCLGDINRAKSQWKRGGGTVCFSNYDVYRSFKQILSSQQTCPIKFYPNQKN
ncbi:hypothetical protein ABPG72_005092 [Tetrahymena utriculariae]